MGPHEISEVADLIDDMLSILGRLPLGTTALEYDVGHTESFRENLLKLRMKSAQLVSGFPEEHFPIANRATREFSNEVDALVSLFPGDVQGLKVALNGMKTNWHIKVRTSVYVLELALAITPGVYLPEDPGLFAGKDRYLRDITIEINMAFRNGAYNACSVLLRRLLETLIIKAHTRNGTTEMAKNRNDEF